VDRPERERRGDDDRADRELVDTGEEGGRVAELPDEDVQVGPELTDRPRAGSTEPPD
jgi:hypothetical protein